MFVDVDEELAEAAAGADDGLPSDDGGHDLDPDALVHQVLHPFVDGGPVPAAVVLEAFDEIVDRQGRLVLFSPSLVERVQASGADELLKPQDRQQPVLPRRYNRKLWIAVVRQVAYPSR